MRTITISTILGTASNRSANSIVAGVKRTDLLRDLCLLCERIARGLDVALKQRVAVGYWFAAFTGRQPAGHSWQPVVCRMSMPTRSQRHDRRRTTGVVVTSDTVGVG
jgi:hypothetical protein